MSVASMYVNCNFIPFFALVLYKEPKRKRIERKQKVNNFAMTSCNAEVSAALMCSCSLYK